MIRSRNILLLFVLSAILVVCGCKKTYVTDESGDSGFTGIKEDEDDYTGGGGDTVFIVFSNSKVSSTDNKYVSVHHTTATITAGGTYCISGSTADGGIIVDAPDQKDVRLVLKRASISSFSTSPLYVKAAQKVIIVTMPGTNNYLSDGSLYSYDDPENEEPNGCIFSKSDLTFYGTGRLTVRGNFRYGINSKDGLIIKSGTIDVTSVKTAVRGKDYILVYDGNISVNSMADGLKSDNAEDKGAGFILIKGGSYTITSLGDAITAHSDLTIDYAAMNLKTGGGSGTSTVVQGYKGDVSAKGLKAGSYIAVNGGDISVNSADAAMRSDTSFVMSGGNIIINTMDVAIHADENLTVEAGSINVKKASCGLKSAGITIRGGKLTLTSTADPVYCTRGFPTGYDDGSELSVTGGTTVLNPLIGTGLYCNGSASIAGGTLVIQGPPAAPGLAADVKGSFAVNGGMFIASGPACGSMIKGPDAASMQNSILINGPSSDPQTATIFPSDMFIDVRDQNGQDLVTFKPSRTAYYIIFSSPGLITGSAYRIYTAGTYTGGTSSNGLYSGGYFTPGTLKKSFNISSGVTELDF